MARGLFDPTKPPGRPPISKGRYLAYIKDGQIVVQKWPRKRGSRRTPAQRWWTEWLRVVMHNMKLAPPGEYQYIDRFTRGTPIKVSDIYMKLARGTLYAVPDERGYTIWPRQAVEKVSYSLDAIAQYVGSLLVRGKDDWQGLSPGPAGTVLTSNGPDTVPTWAESTAGGSSNALYEFPTGYSRPTPDAYPDSFGSPTPAITASPLGGTVTTVTSSGANRNNAAVLKAAPTAPFTLDTVLTIQRDANHSGAVGIALFNAPFHYLTIIGTVQDTATLDLAYGYGTATDENGSMPVTLVPYTVTYGPITLTVTVTAEMISVNVGHAGVPGTPAFTIPYNAQFPSVTHIGYGASMAYNARIRPQIHTIAERWR